MDEGLLQAWLDGPRGGLSEPDRAQVEQHLAQCPDCRARADSLRATGDNAAELLALAGGLEDGEIPEFAAVVARARELDGPAAPVEPREPVGRRSRRTWALGWAASVVLALGAGWMANQVQRERGLAAPGRSAQPEAGPRMTDQVPPVERSAESESRSPAEPPDASEAVAAEDASPSQGSTVETVAEASVPAPSARARQLDALPVSAPVVVTGKVVDAESGRPLESAQVFVPGTSAGARTGADGSYALTIVPPAGGGSDTLALRVEVIGYNSESQLLALGEADTVSRNFGLGATAIALEEVMVSGDEAPTAADLAWQILPLGEAQEAVGFRIRTVPGLELLRVGVHSGQDASLVQVVQDLGNGQRLTLIQSVGDVAGELEAGDGAAVVLLEDGVLVSARGPLPGDSVRSLLGRLR